MASNISRRNFVAAAATASVAAIAGTQAALAAEATDPEVPAMAAGSMSPETTECCRALVRAAKEAGTLISFDLNYRAAFWEGREQELSVAFRELAEASDMLFGSADVMDLCLGIGKPEATDPVERGKEALALARAAYPGASLVATTMREVRSANEHVWGAALTLDGELVVEEPRPVPVLDRIGGGDGFTAGVLYGVLEGRDAAECLSLGWAGGVLAMATLHDFAEPADEAQLWDIHTGSADVRR